MNNDDINDEMNILKKINTTFTAVMSISLSLLNYSVVKKLTIL